MIWRLRHKSAMLRDARTKGTTGDPTGTSDIRRRYSTLLDIRWRKFIVQMREAVLTQDMLTLNSSKPTVLGLALSAMGSDAKTKAFQTWVDATLHRIVLDGTADYLDPMIDATYKRALTRAQRLVKRNVVPTNMQDVVWNLQQLTLTELQGITEAVSQALVRAAAQAQLNNTKPAIVIREMADRVTKIGITRSRATVEVMVVKTHAQASLDTLEAAGVKRVKLVPENVRAISRTSDARVTPTPRNAANVGREKVPTGKTIRSITRAEQRIQRAFKAVEVEVETAGDDRVCPECEDIAADGPYTINAARSLIPAHPRCRCAFIPADDPDIQIPEGFGLDE